MGDPDNLPYRPCAGLILTNPDGLIFAAQRNDTPNAWQMPQGGIDPGETAEHAVLRELEEETSIPPAQVDLIAAAPEPIRYDLPPHLLGKVWKGRFRGQEQYWFMGRFLGNDTEIDLNTQHPEFDAWRWMPQAEILDHIVAFKRDVYRKVLDVFAAHL